jgi:hypothetical protein
MAEDDEGRGDSQGLGRGRSDLYADMARNSLHRREQRILKTGDRIAWFGLLSMALAGLLWAAFS